MHIFLNVKKNTWCLSNAKKLLVLCVTFSRNVGVWGVGVCVGGGWVCVCGGGGAGGCVGGGGWGVLNKCSSFISVFIKKYIFQINETMNEHFDYSLVFIQTLTKIKYSLKITKKIFSVVV